MTHGKPLRDSYTISTQYYQKETYMKKGMLLLMCMALGTVVFAQGYTYKDADFAATAERIAQNKIVAEFPDGFYSDDENKAESTYSDRRALLQAAQEQYAKNPKSFTLA